MSGARNGKRRRKNGDAVREERSAGGVVVRPAPGGPWYLLIRDSYGHWGFPKGHLERGEASDAAALREVMEETGVRSLALVASIATIDWKFRVRGKVVHKHCEFFLMETEGTSTKPQRAEGITACKWVTAADAHGLIGYENAREVLRLAEGMVEQRSRVALRA